MARPSVVLAIGGFDGSGGAGTLADARAIQLNGCFPCAIVTAITAQNTTRVDKVETVPANLIRRQLMCLVDDFQIDAIKIGLLPNSATVKTLIECFSTGAIDCPIVVDPVMHATSGGKLADSEAIGAVVDGLLPLTTLFTPNSEEASRLTNRSVDSLADAITAGAQLVDMGCRNVLLKGGHLDIDKGSDVWCFDRGYEVFEPIRREEGTVRGTGCMLSSALACHLGKERSVRNAIISSKAFINEVFTKQHSIGNGTPLTTAGIRSANS